MTEGEAARTADAPAIIRSALRAKTVLSLVGVLLIQRTI